VPWGISFKIDVLIVDTPFLIPDTRFNTSPSGIHYLPPVEFEAILQDKDRKQELGQVTLKLVD
jgi:hypothetical protein